MKNYIYIYTHIYVQPSHLALQKKLTQHCKSTTSIKYKKKEAALTT